MDIADEPPLLQCLRIQGRVMHALLLREIITRFGRENLGVIWLVGEPMLFTSGIVTLWSMVTLHHGSAIPIVAFAVTGYSSVLLWRNCATHAAGAIAQNKSLLFHRNVRIVDVLLTRIVVEIGGATGSFIVLSLLFIYIGWMPMPDNLLKVLFGWTMLAWFGTSLALLIGAATAFSELVPRLWNPVSYLMFPISGAAFMVDWLPERLQNIVLLLPMVHGVEILREGYFHNAVAAHYNLGYMASCCLILSLSGLYVVHQASRHVDF
ncbi:MAG TPA: ABC transporter permease [Steroidobacteraceae bacterium]|nr:ABC transporter permease [Steroidobacteraceae bacterium]